MPGLIYADRVQETTTTTGTGTVTLAGAVADYRTFSAVCVDKQVVYYVIDDGAGNWEVGVGTFTSSGTTLSRDRVLASSNAGALVNFAAGTKNVWLDQPASTVADIAMVAAFAMRMVPQ
jgi:hypothetical protein